LDVDARMKYSGVFTSAFSFSFASALAIYKSLRALSVDAGNSPRTGEREEGMSDLSRRSFSSAKFTAPGYKTPRRLPSLRCLLFLNAACNVIQHARHSARHVNAAASKYGYRGSLPFAEDTGDCLAAVSRVSIVLGIYERSIGSRAKVRTESK